MEIANEVLTLDGNRRACSGGVDADESDKIQRLRIRGRTKRLLVDHRFTSRVHVRNFLLSVMGVEFYFNKEIVWLRIINSGKKDVFIIFKFIDGVTSNFPDPFVVGKKETLYLDSTQIPNNVNFVKVSSLAESQPIRLTIGLGGLI